MVSQPDGTSISVQYWIFWRRMNKGLSMVFLLSLILVDSVHYPKSFSQANFTPISNWSGFPGLFTVAENILVALLKAQVHLKLKAAPETFHMVSIEEFFKLEEGYVTSCHVHRHAFKGLVLWQNVNLLPCLQFMLKKFETLCNDSKRMVCNMCKKWCWEICNWHFNLHFKIGC